MILVVDASVALKWFFKNRDNEADCDLALAVLSGITGDRSYYDKVFGFGQISLLHVLRTAF